MINQNYTLREIKQSDQDFLFEMLYQSIYVDPSTPKPDRNIINDPKISKYVENWGTNGDYGLIAVDIKTGENLGATWIRYLKWDNKGYGYIADNIPEMGIAVDYNKRGLGIGSELLKQLINNIRNKINTVSLSVDAGNPVIGLYKRVGFIECGASGTSITMRKDIL